jgi:hypothetical protein
MLSLSEFRVLDRFQGSDQDGSDAARGPVRLSAGRSLCGAKEQRLAARNGLANRGERRCPVLSATLMAPSSAMLML